MHIFDDNSDLNSSIECEMRLAALSNLISSHVLSCTAGLGPSLLSAVSNRVNKNRVRLKLETVELLVFSRGNKKLVEWH